MDTAEITRLASDFARAHGYEVGEYTMRVGKKGRGWEVYFQRETVAKARPGDFFSVYVDERSRSATRIIYGK